MKTIDISKASKLVLKRLEENKEKAYLVGGCVRDFIMNRHPSDFDVTTSAKPDKIEKIFADFPLVTLGKNFGTIGVLVDNELVEVTTFRSDGEYSDGRHPENVSFSNSLEEDLKRRDFTINAMAMDLRGNIIDIFSGREDIEKRQIQCVGNPLERFSEDKLRMLRAVRFSNRFSFSIEENTFFAIKKMAEKLNEVSKERIQEELNKILLSDSPANGVLLLNETGLLKEIISEIILTIGYNQKSIYHDKDLFHHTLSVLEKTPKKLHLRLAALLHDLGKLETLSIDEKGIGHFYGHEDISSKKAEDILKRLRYSKKTINDTKLVIELHMKVDPNMGDKGLKRLIRTCGNDLVLDLMDFMIADFMSTRDDRDPSFLNRRKARIAELLEEKTVVDSSGLEINGKDLMKIGYKEGKAIGNLLDYLTELVIDDESLNKKEKLLEIAKDKLLEEIWVDYLEQTE